MRIGIDARFLTHPQPGGFKTYTENLVAALADLDRENEYFLYVDRTPGALDRIPTQANFHTSVISGTLPIVGFPWREQIQLPRQVDADRINLFHSPCLTSPLHLSCPTVTTVHDMIWAFPERFSQPGTWSIKRKFMEWYNYFVPAHATKRASAIITVSHAARDSIIEHLPFPREKIHVAWEAVGPSFHQISDIQCLDIVRHKYDLHSKFILAIGSADPRKNISTLVHAYSLLPKNVQEEYRLAVVWAHSLLADGSSRQVNGLGLAGKVQFLEDVTNEDLGLLYNAASLFVFPSLYEGFGLPLLEAMACGAPVVAANTSSIPEVAGDAALFFEAKDAQGMAETIAYVLSHEDVKADLVQKGLKRNALFSWAKCAGETLSVYKHVMASQHSL
jgi:glycosyltransferase involved in cell wall biosynthesis